MRRITGLMAVAAIATVTLLPFAASAASPYTLAPWVYDPDNTGIIIAEETPTGELRLEKNGPTATNAAAGAEILGVAGLSTTGMVLSFDADGYCGAGAPRFNVYLESGGTVFLGCIHGDSDMDGHVVFEAGQTYGGVLFPEGEVVSGIDIVQDEEGQTTLSNIMINDMLAEFEEEVPPPSYPLTKDDCKNGGWMNYSQDITFKNQGQCIQYVNTGK